MLMCVTPSTCSSRIVRRYQTPSFLTPFRRSGFLLPPYSLYWPRIKTRLERIRNPNLVGACQGRGRRGWPLSALSLIAQSHPRVVSMLLPGDREREHAPGHRTVDPKWVSFASALARKRTRTPLFASLES